MNIFKTTMVIGMLFILSGCMSMPLFDSNEYLMFSQVKTQGILGKQVCDTPLKVRDRLHNIMETSELLVVFTEYPPNNENTHKVAVLIRDLGKEMSERYDIQLLAARSVSVGYCKLKFNNIIEATDKIMKVLGDRRPSNGII